jgi:uncharacterized protein YutE (UPF0331/DUF86 family)
MNKERLLLLEAEIREQLKMVDRIYKRIEERKESFKGSKEGIESMAYQLHNLYGAYEELFEIIADFFENEIEGVRYHSNLLKRMKMEIRGIRPLLLSEETYQLLDELRRFRHLFRHAYGMEIEKERVEKVLEGALQVQAKFMADLEKFLEALR